MNLIQKVWSKVARELKPSAANAQNERWSFFRVMLFLTSKRGQRRIRILMKKSFHVLLRILSGKPIFNQDYQAWIKKFMPSEEDFARFAKEQESFAYRPLISIVVPVYDPPPAYFRQTLESVVDQVYPHWELCLADDCSPNPEIKAIIEEFRQRDARIKVVYRETNGHISAASNSALALATGEFISLLDHDDLLTRDALFQVVHTLNANREWDLIYTDEDKVEENGKFTEPFFKPAWCPDNLISRNYIGHLTTIRKSLVDEVSGFREGYEGSQDLDLLLRVTERSQRITRIPKILYHWRIHRASAAESRKAKPYAFNSAVKAIEDAFVRRNEPGRVKLIEGLPGYYDIRYAVKEPAMVSIIIPSKDQAKVLDVCLTSVFGKTDYPTFEVVLLDNNSSEDDFFELVRKWQAAEPERFRYFEYAEPFNYAKLMNFGANHSRGDYYLLLNNDTEVIQADWMRAMVEQAQRSSIGAVGVKLLYHNDTIQHAGVVMGIGGIAGHTFVGFPDDYEGYYHNAELINNYSAVTAACLLVEKQKYWQVEGFTESLAVEYNDVDFCLKLHAAGFHNIYLPHVQVYHYESLSRGHPHLTKESYERHLRESAIIREKWQHYIEDDPCYNPNLSLEVTHFLVRTE